jgi:hypothetical protein
VEEEASQEKADVASGLPPPQNWSGSDSIVLPDGKRVKVEDPKGFQDVIVLKEIS